MKTCYLCNKEPNDNVEFGTFVYINKDLQQCAICGKCFAKSLLSYDTHTSIDENYTYDKTVDESPKNLMHSTIKESLNKLTVDEALKHVYPMEDITFKDVITVAGLQFGDYNKVLKTNHKLLNPGTHVQCIWEKNNPYDARAIRLDLPDKSKLGYIPLKYKHKDKFFQALENNGEVKASIKGHNKENPSWTKVTIYVEISYGKSI